MADTKISALPAISAVVAASEFASHESSASAKATALQIAQYTAGVLRPADSVFRPDAFSGFGYGAITDDASDGDFGGGGNADPSNTPSSYRESLPALQLWTTDTPGSAYALWRWDANIYRGDAARRGGFLLRFRWFFEFGGGTGHRGFIGLRANSTIADIVATPADFAADNPTDFIECIGVRWSGANNLILVHNDDAGALTETDLGSDFLVTNSNAVLQLTLACDPNGSGIRWVVERLDNGDIASGTATTNLPSSDEMLSFIAGSNNNACGWSFFGAELWRGNPYG